MTTSPQIWCVVPAAGTGKRFGGAVPKQYLPLNSKTVVEHTLERLLQVESIKQLIIAISSEDTHFKTLPISHNEKVKTVMGGDERCHSVLSGLQYLCRIGDDQDWVLVHDVARPCVRADDIRKLIDQVEQFDAVGGILATPVRDTMKRSNRLNQIEKTVERDQLWHALTPQMFRLGKLRQAIESALDDSFLVTDEASAMEHLGEKPLLVEGYADNIKITHPQDLPMAGLYIQQQNLQQEHTQ